MYENFLKITLGMDGIHFEIIRKIIETGDVRKLSENHTKDR